MIKLALPKQLVPGKKRPDHPSPSVPAPVRSQKSAWTFWSQDPIRFDILADEDAEAVRQDRLIRLIRAETIVICILAFILILGIPFFHPIYQYFALNPEQKRLPMLGLTVPNMTNRAVLSWSTTTITEVMTMGFGDYETHLKGQKFRFTSEGWESFATAFDRQKIGESFRKNQLVMTTVPSNTSIILAQGENAKHVYQWNVQMPVIITFATNNNVSRRQNSIIDLTIIRVPSEQNPDGIGIQNWSVGG